MGRSSAELAEFLAMEVRHGRSVSGHLLGCLRISRNWGESIIEQWLRIIQLSLLLESEGVMLVTTLWTSERCVMLLEEQYSRGSQLLEDLEGIVAEMEAMGFGMPGTEQVVHGECFHYRRLRVPKVRRFGMESLGEDVGMNIDSVERRESAWDMLQTELVPRERSRCLVQ